MFTRNLIFTLLAFVAITVSAQRLSHSLDEVVVTANRPMKEIGVQKVAVDSSALKENIALSMADVIGYNSSLFVKTSGRATLSTVSFRGAAPSHTGVNWNGIPINSPALGMTDFSLIPGYFVDRADLLYGSSSLSSASGSLGGAVNLSTSVADIPDGFNLQYVQGVGSFTTFDEFLRIGYGSDKWHLSTRAVYSTSKNDFKFVNRDKKENILDENHNIVSQYHPTERNSNGAYKDFHVLQQIYFTPNAQNRFGLDAWYTRADRNIPRTTVDYLTSRQFLNKQLENALRAVLSYSNTSSRLRSNVKAGYVYSSIDYDYGFSLGDDELQKMITSRTHINSLFLKSNFDYMLRENFFVELDASFTNHHIKTVDHAAMAGPLGYSKGRFEIDAALSLRWQITHDLGVRAIMRENVLAGKWQSIVPALFADYVVYRPVNLTLKASVARNLHAPTLNDLYFVPGGNPDLKTETGFTYDAGASFSARAGGVALSGQATWFDSHISDWIIWLPNNKGFFSPRNLQNVHSYGIEAKFGVGVKPFSEAYLDLNTSFAWTASINNKQKFSAYDKSLGRQLPYVPLYSASGTLTFSWRKWSLLYKTCFYSKRYTMSSNENSVSGSLPSYVMHTAQLERRFDFRPLAMSLKLAVNNIFNKEYQTILSHPMPGINFEFFISITPKFSK